MKINISFEPTKVNNYTNFSILAQNSVELNDVDMGEAEEILALGVVEFIPRHLFVKTLGDWVSKLGHGGRITFDFVDLYTVCRLSYLKVLDAETVNVLLHGDHSKGWNEKKINLDIPTICKLLEQMGLKVLSKNLDGVTATIVAERQ